jgi:hypothetical protein
MSLYGVANWPNKYVYASDNLAFSSIVIVPVILDITQYLNLTTYANMLPIEHVITFTHLAEAGKSFGVQHQVIAFTHTAKPGGTFRRTLISDLGFSSDVTYLDDSPCGRKRYTPFRGINSEMPDQQDAQYTGSDRFKLYYPSRGVRVSELVIRAPQFGNKDRNAYNRVSRETRGGTLVVYADPTWPKVRTMSVTVSGLLSTEIENLQDFLYTYLGVQVGITDWEGYEWEGVIVDPGQPAVQDGKSRWTITFNFEGEIIDGYSPGSDLNTSQATETAKDPGANSDLGLAYRLAGPVQLDSGMGVAFKHSASATVL